MIQEISIENYKSIKTLSDFELKPVNILIGANNSGKSNFLDVFAFLRDTLRDNISQNHTGNKGSSWRGALAKRGGGESVCFAGERHFRIDCLSQALRYSLSIAVDAYGQSYQLQDEQFMKIASELRLFVLENREVKIYDENGGKLLSKIPLSDETGLYHFLKRCYGEQQAQSFAKKLSELKIYDRIHTEIWSPIRTPKVPKGETILDEDGGNLVGVLHQLSQTQPQFLERLNSSLRVLFDDFAQLSFPSNNQGELLIRWEDKNGRISSASQLSDGTLKFLCLIAILKNPNPPALIGIDEIDANLHPKMQSILADIIAEASRKTQIVATTHNPDFLSMFTPDEIVILQQHKGATEMRRFSTKGALELWMEDFGTRELWLMGELESRW